MYQRYSEEERRYRRVQSALKWRAKNPDKARKIWDNFTARHRQLGTKRWRKYLVSVQERRKFWRAWLVIESGGQCAQCGYSDPRALQFDHVNGNGHYERKYDYSAATPSRASTENIARRVLDRIRRGELQLLCANCNWIKRVERNEVGTPWSIRKNRQGGS